MSSTHLEIGMNLEIPRQDNLSSFLEQRRRPRSERHELFRPWDSQLMGLNSCIKILTLDRYTSSACCLALHRCANFVISRIDYPIICGAPHHQKDKYNANWQEELCVHLGVLLAKYHPWQKVGETWRAW